MPAVAHAADLKVATTDPRDITATGATLHADVDHATGGGNLTWQYGATTAYGATTLAVALTAQDARQQPSLPLACLTPKTTYHVRAVVTSGLATVYGADKKFVTGAGSANPSCTAGSGDDGGASGSGSGTTTTPATGTATTTTTAPSSSTGTGSGSSTGQAAADGSGATTAPGVATEAVTPVLGRTLAAATVAGTVTATAPSGAAVDLATAQTVPTGTIIDTRTGAVELKSALDAAGATQTARFWGGKFEVRQDARHGGMTQIVLRGGKFARCPATRAVARAASTSTATKKKPPRSLWGSDDHGRYQTRGRGSVATVRGTRWHTEDRCDGTLTTVTAGAVAVRDLRRQRTVVVTKGHHYLAQVRR